MGWENSPKLRQIGTEGLIASGEVLPVAITDRDLLNPLDLR
jgi:hypothetical protein